MPGVTKAPAATMAPPSTTQPSMTVALMPTKLSSSSRQPWIRHIWPTVTRLPIQVAWLPPLTCTMVPSCRLVPSPTWMVCTSPRSTQLNQMPVRAPMVTLPMTTAFGAIKASPAMVGKVPLKGRIMPLMEASALMQARRSR